jgi:NAD+ synthase (glutamine-hydrolysing)
MKIAVAQNNYHIGNFAENLSKITTDIATAREHGCDLVIFSELAVCGYPPLDLLEHELFISACDTAVKTIAGHAAGIGVLIGAPTVNTHPAGKKLHNSACFLFDGRIRDVFHKTLLPTYDIFDEYRYFEPNTIFRLLDFKGKKIAVTICEDLWFDQPVMSHFANKRLYVVDPVSELTRLNPDLIINISASPFSYNRMEGKSQVFTSCAVKNNLPVIIVNQVGAQTELIFEGGSVAVNARGKVIRELKTFEEDLLWFDFKELTGRGKSPEPYSRARQVEFMYHALVMGVHDYFSKSGFSRAVLGLSGGIDSAVTLVIAAEALGKKNVHALLLPSQYSSDHSLTDSEKLCRKIGCSYDIISIRDVFEAFRKALHPVFKDHPEDITEENIQSRIRGNLLMAYSNKFGHLLLNTSNKSEAAVGYSTLYGDLTGGLSVLGDVYKTYVYHLAGYINSNGEIIPGSIITKAPSAELRPDQKDTDNLPEYDLLDRILYAYIEQQKDAGAIIAAGEDPGIVSRIISMVNHNEYKRYQAPPILRISTKAFGAGRRMPLVAKY